jgi:hypothetical protein
MKKNQVAIIALGLWLVLVIITMVLAGIIDFELFFVMSFLGVLIIIKLMEPKFVSGDYQKYVVYFIIAGIVIFCAIAVHRTFESLNY